MLKVNLRLDKGERLTMKEADDSLEHLSSHQPAGDQLYTGGTYTVNGQQESKLPEDGNVFQLAVLGGAIRLTGGTVDGVENAIITERGISTYVKEDGDWKRLGGSAVSTGSVNYAVHSDNVVANLSQRLYWINSTGGARTFTIPPNLPINTTFRIIRQGGNPVTILTSGSEGVYNPATGAVDPTGALINQTNREILVAKLGDDEWRIARD